MLSAAWVRSVLERFSVRSCNVVQLGLCSVCRIVFLVAGSVSAWQVAQPRRWLLHCLLNPFPDPGISIRAASAQSMRGGGIKIPPETAPGGFLVPRDRESEESRAISSNFYRNGTFPQHSAAS